MTHPTQIQKSQAQAQVPKGYKMTKLGVIPEEWDDFNFEDCLNGFSSGSTPSRANDKFFKGDILWISSGELNYNVIQDTKEKVSEEALKSANLKLLKPGTFLMAITGLEAAGTRGSCAIVGKPATTNQSCMSMHPKSNLDIEYFFQFYCHYGDKLAFRYCQGTKQQSYNGEIVRTLPLNSPPLPEQRAIAACLGTWDRAIEKLDQLIKLKEQRKKGLMQQLLTGKKRLPGFSGEWEEKQLGKYFKERSEKGQTDLPLLSIGELGVYPQDESNKKDTSNQDKSLYKRICIGDIGYNTMRMWQGRSALSSLEGIVSPAYTIVAPRANADAKFFSYLFKLQSTIHKFYRNSQGLVSDTWNCKYKDFAIVKVDLPPTIEEQKAIAKVLTTADKEIKQLNHQLNQLRDQKKGMMQQLLTGKKRLGI